MRYIFNAMHSSALIVALVPSATQLFNAKKELGQRLTRSKEVTILETEGKKGRVTFKD